MNPLLSDKCLKVVNWVAHYHARYSKVDWEDLYQEGLMGVHLRSKCYDPKKSAPTTFVRMVAWRAITGYLRRAKRPTVRALPKDYRADNGHEVEDLLSAFDDAVRTLTPNSTPDERTVLRLVFVEGHTRREAARLMGWDKTRPSQMVASFKRKALEKRDAQSDLEVERLHQARRVQEGRPAAGPGKELRHA